MIQAIAQGVLLGVALSLSAGPTFVALVSTSMRHGARAGVALALGVLLVDGGFALVASMGLAVILPDPRESLLASVVGGLAIVAIGVATLRSGALELETDSSSSPSKGSPSLIRHSLTGILVNIAQPPLLAFWTGAVAFARSEHAPYAWVHLGCILGTVFAFDCTKAVFSHRLSSTVGPAQWRMLNRVSGALIVAFGLAVMSSSLW